MIELTLIRNTCPNNPKWIRILDDKENSQLVIQSENMYGVVIGKFPFLYNIRDKNIVLRHILEVYKCMGFKHTKWMTNEVEKIWNMI